MKPTRRAVLAGGLGWVACGSRASLPAIEGQLLGLEDAARGHLVRAALRALPTDGAHVDVAILGGGIAGLSAAYRLASAGFQGSVAIFDLGDAPGGTAIGDRFPWGAHYVTLPNPTAVHVRRMLHAFGVIEGFDADGRAAYRERDLCNAPQERVFDGGVWSDGLIPEHRAAADHEELAAFEATCRAFTHRVGSDGLPAFDIPVHRSSMDPELRALADVSFADWLTGQGFRSETLRWVARYAVRDDFGAEPEAVSAWAGLHYHCSRRPDPTVQDLGTHVLTWPEGNGWLVRQLLQRLPWPVTSRTVVRAVAPEEGVVRLAVEADGLREVVAGAVIAALPTRVMERLMVLPPGPRPELAPWRVAAIHVDRLPASRGVPFAWDSVRFAGAGLGYVSNVHQTAAFRGPAVLTYYEPFSEGPPSEQRRRLFETSYEAHIDSVLSDLAPAHPDLREVCTRIDVRPWGHGTAIPTVGLHRDDALLTAARPHERVWLAHTDRSGMSLFEEASWQGVRAAEELLAWLGRPTPDRWT